MVEDKENNPRSLRSSIDYSQVENIIAPPASSLQDIHSIIKKSRSLRNSIDLSNKQAEDILKLSALQPKDVTISLKDLHIGMPRQEAQPLSELKINHNIQNLTNHSNLGEAHSYNYFTHAKNGMVQNSLDAHKPLKEQRSSVTDHGFGSNHSKNGTNHQHEEKYLPNLRDSQVYYQSAQSKNFDSPVESIQLNVEDPFLVVDTDGIESFRAPDDNSTAINKKQDSLSSLTLNERHHIDLPYKPPERDETASKKDLPLQTPQFKAGDFGKQNGFDMKPKENIESKAHDKTMAPPNSNQLSFEDELGDVVTQRKDNYRTLTSEYDNYVSPKEYDEISRKYSFDVQKKRDEPSFEALDVSESVPNKKQNGPEQDDIITTIDKNIKLLEDSLLHLDQNINHLDISEVQTQRRKSLTIKPMEGDEKDEASDKFDEEVTERPKKPKNIKKKKKKSTEVSPVNRKSTPLIFVFS